MRRAFCFASLSLLRFSHCAAKSRPFCTILREFVELRKVHNLSCEILSNSATDWLKSLKICYPLYSILALFSLCSRQPNLQCKRSCHAYDHKRGEVFRSISCFLFSENFKTCISGLSVISDDSSLCPRGH